jgi:hypothetical protein
MTIRRRPARGTCPHCGLTKAIRMTKAIAGTMREHGPDCPGVGRPPVEPTPPMLAAVAPPSATPASEPTAAPVEAVEPAAGPETWPAGPGVPMPLIGRCILPRDPAEAPATLRPQDFLVGDQVERVGGHTALPGRVRALILGGPDRSVEVDWGRGFVTVHGDRTIHQIRRVGRVAPLRAEVSHRDLPTSLEELPAPGLPLMTELSAELAEARATVARLRSQADEEARLTDTAIRDAQALRAEVADLRDALGHATALIGALGRRLPSPGHIPTESDGSRLTVATLSDTLPT